MLNNQKNLQIRQNKRRMLSQQGFTTLTAMLVILSLLSGVLLSYGLISYFMNRNELYRREVVLSRNILLSYNSYLFNHFGLLAYDCNSVDLKGLISSQFDEAKFCGVTHKLIGLTTLPTTSELLQQVMSVTTLRVVKGVIKDQEGVQHAMDSVAPMVKDLKSIGQNPVSSNASSSANAKRTAGETKRLDSYRQKMRQMKKTMKENGMVIKEDAADTPNSGDENTDNSGTVKWVSLKVNRDRNPTLIEKGYLITYIMGVFSDRVTSKVGELEFYDVEKRSSPMAKGEIEYVLIGSHSREWNCKVVAGEIFALRTGVRMKEVLMDRPLMMQLTEESVALAALLPVIPQPAILTSLVAAEAAERATKDLAKLLNGEGVEIFPGVSKLLYYDDYLIFLLGGNSDTKLMERMLEIVSMAYGLDCRQELNLEQMMVRHQIEANARGKTILKVEDGYFEKQEKGASWSTNSP